MTTPITTNATDSQMHNNIIAAGLRDHPLMLATGRYAQWQSCFMRYVDTKPNGEALKICILQVPYKLSNLIIPCQPAIDDFPVTVIGNDIYSSVDACKIAHDMWIAIESQECKSLALVAAAQQYSDTYYQTPKPNKSYPPSLKQSSSTRSHASTRYKGKEIAKPVTPPSKSASVEDSDPKQAQIDKDMQNNLALIAKKPKRAKEYTYHKENMLMCKQAEKGVPLRTEHKSGSVAEPLEKVQPDADYNVFVNERQHFEQPESINDTYVVEKDDSNVIPDSSNMCDHDNQADQNAAECDDERVVLANLIVNLTVTSGNFQKFKRLF
ncbi:hypothetical protein Tco_0863624 [Tanacetum coccineum]